MDIDNLDGSCEPCAPNSTVADEQEQVLWLSELNGWQIVDKKGVKQLLMVCDTKNFSSSLNIANKIAELAEKADHHPALLVEWGRITIRWWTHSIGGLHKNDFIMAKRTSELLNAK